MSKVVFQTDWFRVIQNNLKDFHKPYYTIETGDGVVVLALTKNKEIVLVRQYRPPSRSWTLELPSGAKGEKEPALKAAKRELFEETGYTSTRFHLLSRNLAIMENRIVGRNSFFLALDAQKNGAHAPEKNMHTVLVRQSDFEDLIKTGKFRHTAGIAALALAKLHSYL